MKHFIFFWSLGLVAGVSVLATEVRLDYLLSGGGAVTQTMTLEEKGSVQYLTIPAESVPAKAARLRIHHPVARAKKGEDGFFVTCNGMYGTFQNRNKDAEYQVRANVMSLFGVKTPMGALAIILTGFRYEAIQCVEHRGDQYSVYLQYPLYGKKPYEDIKVEFHQLGPNATYVDVGKAYRNHQLARGVVKPLKERVKNSPELAYSASAPYIRARLCWKVHPTPVAEQTAENEPPVIVAMTLDRFMRVVDEFKRQGIKRAEFCLVGWNTKGHDGRYPQIFPVEESIGGEAKLREAIKKTQRAGYQITCHNNYSDAYSVSALGNRWDGGSYLLRQRDGILMSPGVWSGGKMYATCPECMYKRFVKEDLKQLADLGFRGIHYIDVFGTVSPRACHDERHPLTREGYAYWTRRIFAEHQKTFGGCGSEGGFDYCVSNLDYALYVSNYTPGDKLPELVDRHVPLWHIAYHGIVLNNPFGATMNYKLKTPEIQLKLTEYGGRPVFYYYRHFRDYGTPKMDPIDLRCRDDDELVRSVQTVKESYDEFSNLRQLQLEFLDDHKRIADDVFQTTFSDGTRIVCNYRKTDFKLNGKTVPSMGYVALKPSAK